MRISTAPFPVNCGLDVLTGWSLCNKQNKNCEMQRKTTEKRLTDEITTAQTHYHTTFRLFLAFLGALLQSATFFLWIFALMSCKTYKTFKTNGHFQQRLSMDLVKNSSCKLQQAL